MFWTAVASSTLSASQESSAGLASAAPSYQQQHTKPAALRALASSWQLSHAAFKSRVQQQQQHKLELEELQHEHEQGQEQQHQHDLRLQELELEISVQPKRELQQQEVEQMPQTAAPGKMKIRAKSESKIFKAFTSCKCTRKSKKVRVFEAMPQQ